MRIAHLSDLHFSSPSFNLMQFLSKRWLGNINLLFNRGQKYSNDRSSSLPALFNRLNVDYVLITGDLTTTSHPKEYAIAHHFVERLNQYGLTTFLIPGNHDHYTKRAERQRRFYACFPSELHTLTSQFNLKDHGVTAYSLTKKWILIALDTTCATPLYSSNGLFSQTTETHLRKLLLSLPKDSHIIVMNHFPFLPIGRPRRHLRKGSKLETIIKCDPRIRLYLHGHTHQQSITDLRSQTLPITLDSGSASFDQGSWNLIDLQEKEDRCNLTIYKWESESWQPHQKRHFQWTPQIKTPSLS